MDFTNASQNWYLRITSEFNRLLEELGIDEEAASTLRTFVVTTCKEQYKVGNSSGIRWARQNPPKPEALQKTPATV